MELSGTIKLILAEEVISDRFKKRGVVLTTQEQYPQQIMIEFVQDKTDLLNNFSQGDEVTISINIRGREWTNPKGEVKYFTSINGWRIQKMEAESPGMQDPLPSTPVSNAPSADNEADDLPF